MLIVDSSHALGVVPVDGRLADVTVSAGYKSLCATQLGILAWNRKRRADFEPLPVGWCSGSDAPLPGQPDRTSRPHPDRTRHAAGQYPPLHVFPLNKPNEARDGQAWFKS